MNNFKLISLGYSCHPKLYLRGISSVPTQYFDYIGTSAWTIYQLLKNDFTDDTLPGNISKILISQREENPYLFANTKYYIRYTHEFGDQYNNLTEVPEEKIQAFRQKYQRRKERFLELLNDQTNLLFIRLEEDYDPNRNIYPEIAQYYPSRTDNERTNKTNLTNSEYQYMKKVSELLMTKYQLKNFAILYLTNLRSNHFDQESHIITLYCRHTLHVPIIKSLIERNQQFIDDSLDYILNQAT